MAGDVDESENERSFLANVSQAAAMTAAANLANLDKEDLKEQRKMIKELVSNGAFSSPDQIPDLTIRR